ncbi:Rep [Circovirus rongeur]|uniref:Replication-associated protein n=1 Tax=Circovirus rongeur TaxID=3052131 RepID=A0A2H4MWX5_9CIRC|nr:Rep [Circovirus rongeur]ATP66716.1 Rep [Circovirus rongeur]
MAQAQILQQRLVKQGARGRWCFTINNYTAEEEQAVIALAGEAKYLICGREVGENGTPHLQGFVNLKKKKRFAAMKEALGGRCHLEPARGDDCSNKDYCSKGGDILIEEGVPQRERQRTDLKQACELVTQGGDIRHVARDYPEVFVRYHRGLLALQLYHPDLCLPRQWKTEVFVYVGPPGVGKSRIVQAKAPIGYWKPRGKWWDGYHGNSDVILDDFYGWLPFDDLLRMCDRYPLTVETKGGTTQFLAKRIFITSNKSPSEWYSDEITNKDALYRRLTELHMWTGTCFEHPPPRVMWNHKINY